MRYFVQEYNDDQGRPIVELRCSESGKQLPGKEVDEAGYRAAWKLRDELRYMAAMARLPRQPGRPRIYDAPEVAPAQDQPAAPLDENGRPYVYPSNWRWGKKA